jgi:hypothetical protein
MNSTIVNDDHSQKIVEETAQNEQLHSSNKYKYDEFDGFAGERLLKSILRKVLPLALFETWQVLAEENQARGNDAFLGITKLAEYRQRSDRKMRMDLDDLQGRQLLTIRHDWKIFRQADGSMKASPVSIKDFERLYDLAYEYYQWTQSDWYIPPDRDFADLIHENELLMKKLMRFDNYRRLLCNKKPGPAAQEKEIHRWYKEYEEAATLPGQCQEAAKDVQEVSDNTRESIRKEYLKESLKESLKKASTKRVITNDNTKQQNGDSFNSAICLEGGDAAAGYTKSTSGTVVIPEKEETKDQAPTNQTNQTPKLPQFSGKGRGKQASKKQAPAAPNPLIERFVREFSQILYDENVEGSVTRSLRAVEGLGLPQKDIMACLVKAYTVARDTKTVREKYRRPDGRDLRMPLFCTMFERFTRQRTEDNFSYDDEGLAQWIASDQRLVDFVNELSPEEKDLQVTVESHDEYQQDIRPEELMAVAEDVQQNDYPLASEQQVPLPLLGEEVSEVEPQPEEQQEEQCILVEDPDMGWKTYVDAQWWADKLHERLGSSHYGFNVYPTQYGRYGFMLYARDERSEYGIFLSSNEVKSCM